MRHVQARSSSTDRPRIGQESHNSPGPARRRKELEDRVAEADTEYDEAEAQRAKTESELDANERHVADMRTAIERLNDDLERVRRELTQAQGQTARLRAGP